MKISVTGHDDKVIEWVPPNPTAEEDDEWIVNCKDLIESIERGFGLNRDRIEYILDPDECEMDLDAPDELRELWMDLKDENSLCFQLSVTVTRTRIDPTTPMIIDSNQKAIGDHFFDVPSRSSTAKHKGNRDFQSGMKTEKLRRQRQDGSTQIRRGIREKRLHHKHQTIASKQPTHPAQITSIGTEPQIPIKPNSDILKIAETKDSVTSNPVSCASTITITNAEDIESDTDMKADPGSSVQEMFCPDGESLNVAPLDIPNHLTALGNEIGLLKGEQKRSCGKILRKYVDCNDGEARIIHIQDSLKVIMQDNMYEHRFLCCQT